MAKVLGIIGGGQLGMMLSEAAKKMPEHISKVIVLDPTENCPASQVGAEQIVADFKDKEAIMDLSQKSDIITYEIESGDSQVLKSVEKDSEVNPSPETLKIIQDKLLQKKFLSENGIAVPEFIEISNIEDVQKAFDYFKGQKLLLEKFVPFKMEVSVIAARNTMGEIRTYPLVENIHEHNILRQTIAPARVSEEITKRAEEIAEKTMNVLKGAGIFGIEMFVTQEDQVLINEIAPRVHNSGHHSLESSATSQFEQHLRAILGLELGDTKLIYKTIMYNILGSEKFQGEYKPLEIKEDNVFLKMYGKKISKPLRKLGHFNLVGKNNESVGDLLSKLESLKPKTLVESI